MVTPVCVVALFYYGPLQIKILLILVTIPGTTFWLNGAHELPV